MEDCVWPGDVNRDEGVDGKDIITTGVLAGLNITDGTPRGLTSTEWFAFNSDDWGSSLGDLNAKNGDVNGSGMINETDLEGLTDNFGLTRDGYDNRRVLDDLPDPQGLRSVFEVDTVDLATALLFDRIVNTDIFLGDIQDQIGEPLHGISFDMQFDTNLVAPFNRIDDIFSTVFDYGFGAMPNSARVGNELRGDDNIQYGFTNLDGQNSIEGGPLANQNLFIKDLATTANADGVDTLAVRFFNVCAVTASGEEVEIGVV